MLNNGYYPGQSNNYEPESKRLRFDGPEKKENVNPLTPDPELSNFSQMNPQAHSTPMPQAGFASWGYNNMYPQHMQMNMQQQQQPQQQQQQNSQYQQAQTSQTISVEQNALLMQLHGLTPQQLNVSPDQNQTENTDGSTLGSDEHDSATEDSGNFSGGSSSGFFTNATNINDPPNKIEFCQVPGRLSLLGSNKKLVVTLAEIQRRISPPECLNQSLLSAILRKAKNKDGGTKLNTALKRFNITIPQGRRKSAPNTMFTAFCEQEAVQLANDFGKLNERAFPARSIVYEYLVSMPSWESYKQMRQCAQITLQFLMGFQTFLRYDPSPVMSLDLNRETHFHNDTRDEFINYSMLSHGFGVPGMINSNYTIIRLLTLMLEVKCPKQFALDLRRPVPAWAEYPDPNPLPEFKPDFGSSGVPNGNQSGNANLGGQHFS